MAPSAIMCGADNSLNGARDKYNGHAESAVLHRNIKQVPPVTIQGTGNYLILEDGRRILDTAGGAAVSCLGYDKMPRIDAAIIGQLGYIPFHLCSTNVAEELARFMVDSTQGKMSKFSMYNSGSESMDAAVKLAVQYHQEKVNPEPGRINFIAREGSYHGNTGFALSLSGHRARRGRYEPLLQKNSRFHHIPAVYPYRDRFEGESDKAYIKRKAKELEQKIVELGPETVAAYAMEPVVGATIGSVVPPKGYLKAVDEICKEYGVLLIFDEVMCGMGRTGTLHAWQREGVAPDIQAVGKSLAGGHAPASGILVGPRIADALYEGSGIFMHGHTYQNHGIACAATLEVQKIIQEYDLVENSHEMGELLLGSLRQQLATHAHVGDIRGIGLFVTIEFVRDKATKECFPRAEEIVERISKMALNDPYNIHVYTGCGESVPVRGEGDHILIAPAFTVTEEEVKLIVDKVSRLIDDFPFHSYTKHSGILQTPFTP